MQNSHSQSRLLKLIKNPLVHIVILLAMAFVVLLARGGSDQSLVSTKDGEDDEEDAKASLTLPTTKISSSKDFTLTIGDRAKVQPGLTLVPIAGSEQVILLSTEGQVVHSWDFDVARARLLPNCNLLVLHGSNWGKTKKPWKKMLNLIREYDWDGNVVWEFEAPMELHHDLARLENGNTLVLAKIAVEIPGEEDAEDPVAQHPRRLRTDRVLEVNPLGEVVWSWDAHKHLDTASCGWRDCGEKYEEHRVRDEFIDWTHANTVSPLPENHWFTAGDTRFRPGNLLVLARNFWSSFIVDRATGDIVWTYEGDHKNGTDPAQGLLRGHEANMIEPGYPGAGNILIFDNGAYKLRKHSIVREIDPVSLETVWRWEDPGEFFSQAGSSAQRLRNGNTLISQDRQDGRVFEVTPSGEIVWDLELKHFPHRAKRYEPNYCPNLGT